MAIIYYINVRRFAHTHALDSDKPAHEALQPHITASIGIA